MDAHFDVKQYGCLFFVCWYTYKAGRKGIYTVCMAVKMVGLLRDLSKGMWTLTLVSDGKNVIIVSYSPAVGNRSGV